MMQFEKRVQTSLKEVVVRELRLKDLLDLSETWKSISEGDSVSFRQIGSQVRDFLERSTNLTVEEFRELRFSEIDVVEAAWREANAPFLNRCGGAKKLLERLKILGVATKLLETWLENVREKVSAVLENQGSQEQELTAVRGKTD